MGVQLGEGGRRRNSCMKVRMWWGVLTDWESQAVPGQRIVAVLDSFQCRQNDEHELPHDKWKVTLLIEEAEGEVIVA